MSVPSSPEPATLVVALLVSPHLSAARVVDRAAECFGTLRAVSPEFPFDRSSYYDREMGAGLRRVFAAAGECVDPGTLARWKLRSNELEGEWTEGGCRRVNLDPGLLDLNHLVLASGKPAGHRVYLQEGIYAEVEYVFESGTFKPLPWTYPDYREPEALAFFNQLRELHRRGRKPSPPTRNP